MAVAAMPLPELCDVQDRYLALSRIARERFDGTLGGKLLLQLGFDATGVAVALAGSIAGAATLCVDGEGEVLRQGLRSGLCDFVVANLDEALRILKNEVRRRLAVCVGVTADPKACLAAMVERGVQPDMLGAGTEAADASRMLAERGALVLADEPCVEANTSLLCWGAAGDAARTMPAVARIAAEVLDESRSDTQARRHWLEQSPRYLRRAYGPRQCLRTSAAEARCLVERIRSEVPLAIITREGERP